MRKPTLQETMAPTCIGGSRDFPTMPAWKGRDG